jgi:DNA-binding beta-propeller fold protein YncE
MAGDGQSIGYRLVEGWEQLPPGWSHGDVAGVATDAQDRVYVANRGEHPVIVYDRDGRFLGSWGEGLFTRPHGISITDGVVYCVDDGDHTVRAFSLDGHLRWTLGTAHRPSDTGYRADAPANLRTIERAAGPFHRPTRLAVAPGGELYVADGYGNARIHRFSPDGELLQSWGQPGDQPGQFNLPHSVWVHTDGRVFVCDRENDRIQVFSPTGELLTTWANVTRPGDLYIDREERVYVGEMAWEAGASSLAGRRWPETRASQLSVRDLGGNVLARWGGPDPCAPGSFASPHGLWVDSRGDIYVGEVTQTALSRGGRWHPGCHSLQKFTRV